MRNYRKPMSYESNVLDKNTVKCVPVSRVTIFQKHHFLSLTLSCEHLGRCLTFCRAHELEFMVYLNPVALLPPVRMSSCSAPQLGGPHVNHTFFCSVGSLWPLSFMNSCCKETSDTNKANLKGHGDCMKLCGLVSIFDYRSPDFLEQLFTQMDACRSARAEVRWQDAKRKQTRKRNIEPIVGMGREFAPDWILGCVRPLVVKI